METKTELKTLKENIKLDRIGKKLREIPEEERTLKTLKDINPFMHCDSLYKTISDYDTFSREQLKAEVVKWIKLMDRNKTHYYSHPDARKWIKHFFNLSEGDLK